MNQYEVEIQQLKLKIYEKIASKCFKKIKETSDNEETYCFFKIPIYIPGIPIYNLTECVLYLLNLLHEKGFKARYCDNEMMFVSWNFPKPNMRLLENRPIEDNSKKNIVDQLNLKYKPIESYNSFNNFLPRKKF